jgi:murein DD-endopeptidase MepM/ murein hydrolase activator NlpD
MEPKRPSLLLKIQPDVVNLLLPGCGEAPFCDVAYDREAAHWQEQHPELFADGAHPLLNPANFQHMLDDIHARMDVQWSYGGYLEERSHLLQGSYLEETGGFVHLGVDFMVPQGTPVAAPRSGAVVLVDDDHDQNGGWGPRVFFKLEGGAFDGALLIFAHLQEIMVKPGDRLPCGIIFAEVGGPPYNGNWVPHLHVQAIRSDNLAEVLIEKFEELDGYGHPSHIGTLRETFPDPLPIIGWKWSADPIDDSGTRT